MTTEPVEIAQLRILLADDHDILRQGLKLLLEAQPDLRVVGEARTGRSTLEQVAALQPNIVVLDISMPDIDGLKACQQIRKQYPAIQVLILTMHESEEYFLQALRMGATGYLVKKAAPAELCAAVRIVAQGGAFLYPGLAKALVRAYVQQSPQANQKNLPDTPTQQPGGAKLSQVFSALTPRELEVLKLVAEGHTNQEIADLLVLSIKTVQAHRANVMDKLGLHDITHLVRFAIHYGLIAPDL
ncbi:MAG: response regulator transcription factor [Ktedonobacteraceae bacterium]|nr:response regulator transcription factor [Ktedonobacteraceae bacterium]